MSQVVPQESEIFDLYKLFRDLQRFGDRQLRLHGCFKSNECAEDVTTYYLFDRQLRGAGRAEIQDDKIRISYPGAKKQRSVLYKLFNYELLNKKMSCKDCQWKNLCPVKDAFAPDADDRRDTSQVLIEPSTPAQTLERKELLDICFRAILKSIKKPQRRKAFWLYYEGFSHAEIATLLNVKPDTVRQWHTRDLRRVSASVKAFFGRVPLNFAPT